MSSSDDGIPENAMRLHELRIVNYLNADGEEFTTYKWVGDEPTYVQAIGMIESAKLTMHFLATHVEDEE